MFHQELKDYLAANAAEYATLVEQFRSLPVSLVPDKYESTFLRVSEMFYSLQGEGPRTGRPSVFLRLSGCTLHCTFCDTIEVWKKGVLLSLVEVLFIFSKLVEGLRAVPDLVLTGGSPLLQETTLGKLILLLDAWKKGVHRPEITVETEGVLVPFKGGLLDNRVAQYIVSPKLKNSGMPLARREKRDALVIHADDTRSYFKYAVGNEADFNEAMQQIQALDLNLDRVGFMPIASTRSDLLKDWSTTDLPSLCKKHGVAYHTRLHLLLWDKTTGV